MRLEDMRRSENVEDRRGLGVGRTGAGIGIGTIVLVVAGYFLGISPGTMLSLLGGGESVTQDSAATRRVRPPEPPTDPQGDFAAAVLGETEDVWGKYFAQRGQRYTPPTLVLFTDQVASACGAASAAAGPVLLPGRPEGVHRPRFFQSAVERIWGARRFCACLRHRPRSRPPLAESIGHHREIRTAERSAGCEPGPSACRWPLSCRRIATPASGRCRRSA